MINYLVQLTFYSLIVTTDVSQNQMRRATKRHKFLLAKNSAAITIFAVTTQNRRRWDVRYNDVSVQVVRTQSAPLQLRRRGGNFESVIVIFLIVPAVSITSKTIILLVIVHVRHIQLETQQSTDSTEALDKLTSLLRSVRYELQLCAISSIVVREPFCQSH